LAGFNAEEARKRLDALEEQMAKREAV